jgi:hypothetical protein|tara:strand:+ start:723 stop:2309 length:1587 start_codon:yes stop_codon:yes gene_type:complete
MAAKELNPTQILVHEIARSKFNLLLSDSPNNQLDSLLHNLLGPSSAEEKCNHLEAYISCDENNVMLRPDDYIIYIFGMEIGISRIEFINWLLQKDYDYSKWRNVISLFLELGFPEVRGFLGAIIKSTYTDDNYKSKAAEMQLYCCDQNDLQYLLDNPLSNKYPPEPKLKPGPRKLRIAFTSEKFSTKYLSSQNIFLDTIFAGLPSNVEVWLFSLRDHNDKYTVPYRKNCHQFINLTHLEVEKSRSIIESADIDIVVDIFGATPFRYWRLFENSIRVSLFDVDTFIKNYYHYSLEEENSFPAWKKKFTSLCSVPQQFFWPTPEPVSINLKTPSTTNKYITFGCFSRLIKIHPINYDTWTKLLNEVPKSKMAFSFIQLTSPLKYIILKEFKQRGISSDRVIFFPKTDPKKHLTKYNTIDMVADTFPIGSGFSALDALWMGVPIVGLYKETDTAGNTIKALNILGKEEWIAKNEREYIDICKKLASDQVYRRTLKSTLRQDVIKSDLMDGMKFSKNMYEGLQKIALDNSGR